MSGIPQQQSPTIEVCQGPDCLGSGGGACLFEIEELVLETGESNMESHFVRFKVSRGGCRNLCSMGPNVHTPCQHFTKVNSIVACEKVVRSICTNSDQEDCESGPLPFRIKLMMNRATEQRWKFLRNMARFKANTDAKNSNEKELIQIQQQLDECCRMELNASKSFRDLEERAKRRRVRYQSFLDQIAHQEQPSSGISISSDVANCATNSDSSQRLTG